MKTTYKTIIQNYFHRFQAEVSMAAFSNKKPGLAVQDSDYYRLWYVYEGEGQIIINDRIYEVNKGHLVLLPPGTPQTFGNSKLSVGVFWCHFRAAIGDIEMFDLLNLPICVIPEEQEKERVAALFRLLIEAYRSPLLTRELRIRAAMFEILACYLECVAISANQSLAGNEPIEKIDRVLEYIDDASVGNHRRGRAGPARVSCILTILSAYFKNFVGCSPLSM